MIQGFRAHGFLVQDFRVYLEKAMQIVEKGLDLIPFIMVSYKGLGGFQPGSTY